MSIGLDWKSFEVDRSECLVVWPVKLTDGFGTEYNLGIKKQIEINSFLASSDD